MVPVAACLLAALAQPVHAGSLRFTENLPTQYEFADVPGLHPEFGRGEFTFEIWVKPDTGFRVGPTYRSEYSQLRNWSETDNQPYSSTGWWLPGNWLLDGHSRPEGFDAGDTREGTFSLQFYGGGRLRWMFADKKEGMPRGMVWAAQAFPASSTPSLLDGRWHHVAAVRRWRQPLGARLELWVDGRLVGSTDIPDRTDMRRFWDHPAHPNDPPELGGWAMGAEVMTAWNYEFTQYEDYKGLVDDMRMWGRALSPEEISRLATGAAPADRAALLSHYSFDEGRGDVCRDRLNRGPAIALHRWGQQNWSQENSPASAAR
ncbi:MAG TPA: LamG domain-containing protein [Longimicrobium sp.]